MRDNNTGKLLKILAFEYKIIYRTITKPRPCFLRFVNRPFLGQVIQQRNLMKAY